MATLPVFDSVTPKVSILAIGKNTLDSANELLVEAEKQAAEFQPQATLKADFMLNNYVDAGLATTDLTTGIADWKLEADGSSAPKSTNANITNGTWYTPTGEGKWLGYATTGTNEVTGYTLSFEVTALQTASLNLAFAADDRVESATLNDEALTVDGQGFRTLAGQIGAGSALFKLGTNTLVVRVLNTGGPSGFYAQGTAITGAGAVKCTLANATGARLEFSEEGSTGILAEYKPPKTLEPGEVASFLVDKASFALKYNIQVFQGPMLGWMRPGGDDSESVTLNSTTDRSGEIEADVQVAGPNPGPPARYPTTFIVDVHLVQTPKSTSFDVVQIFAKQLITQTPRG